jgi:hypothetical protein
MYCHRPAFTGPVSPATIVCLAANAQQATGASEVKVAMTMPVSRSHTFSVLSPEADTTRRKTADNIFLLSRNFRDTGKFAAAQRSP